MSLKNSGETGVKEKLPANVTKGIKEFVNKNMVIILFSIICIISIKLSRLSGIFVTRELIARLARNLFLVISLIIPVIAGMGLNFGIVVGAMAGEIAIIFVTYWKIKGIGGFLLCVLLSTPLAIIFGIGTGKLLNKTKGEEMITSMILGFFANGLYQFVFLFLAGGVIPMHDPVLILNTGVGIKNTIDLKNGIGSALDNILKLKLPVSLVIVAIIGVLYCLYKMSGFSFTKKYRRQDIEEKKSKNKKYAVICALFAVLCIWSLVIMNTKSKLNTIPVPVVTFLVIGALCVFNQLIMKTKIGQDFRAVGQDMDAAQMAGINVDRTRIIAIVISTVLAAWGQLIFLQNLGTLNTYTSHEQVGTFAVAAILIGGASVSKATIGQAFIGTVLFHILFTVSPQAGKNLFGDAQIGEFFRAFIAYGVIGISLGLHAWKEKNNTDSE